MATALRGGVDVPDPGPREHSSLTSYASPRCCASAFAGRHRYRVAIDQRDVLGLAELSSHE